MSPLLGRPRLTGHHIALRSALLLVALLLASAPLSSLLAGSSWLTLILIGALPVLAAGLVARYVVSVAVLVPALQLLAIVVLTLVIELQQGLIRLADGPAGIIAAQARIFPGGANELAASIAPVTVGARGTVLVVLLCALVTLALDLMFVDLGWHTPTGFVLMGFVLVPALQQPAGGPWWTLAGPILAGLLIWSARTIHADPSYVEGDRRPQAGPLAAPVRTAVAAIGVSVLVAGIAAPAGQLLPRVVEPRVALNIDLVNQWQNRDLPQLGPVMIDDDVSVRRSLLDQEQIEVLRYTTTAEEPSYLRLRTLNTFDGEAYTASGNVEVGTLESFSDARDTGRAVAGGDLIEHDVLVTNLGGDRLPAPANLRQVQAADDSTDGQLQLLATGGEIGVEDVRGDLSGTNYTIVSEADPAGADVLRHVDPALFDAPFETGYTNPSEVPEITADLAASIAEDAGATNAFDTALAYQDFFRGSFAYSLTVRTPPGEDPLESFLSDRIGYCEQFAAAFALMMTAQGYPTRVAIGFTAGQQDGDEWVVESANAHAWPEVWFGPQHGWVRFEPTPAAANNGVRTPEATDPAAAGADDPAEPDAENETTAPEEDTEDDPSTEETEGAEDETSTEEESEDGTAGDGSAAGPVLSSAARTAVVLAGITAALAGAVAAGILVIRRRRMRLRDARWAALLAGATGGAGARADGAADAAGGAGEESLRRSAGQLAWSELESELRVRVLATHWLGWTGAWGRPPRPLRLDTTLPPAAALTQLLDDIDRGHVVEHVAGEHSVSVGHRAAAERIASAVTAARYAAPTGPPSAPVPSHERASAPVGPGAEPSEEQGPPDLVGPGVEPASADRDGPQPVSPPRPAEHPLRADADLLIDLIRRAR